MYKVVVTAPDFFVDYIRAMLGRMYISMPLGPDSGEENFEQIEFLCRPDSLQSVVDEIKKLDAGDDISLDIYNLTTMHD